MNKPIIGITCGDVNGIGLETIIKVFADNRMLEMCTPVLFSSNKAVNYYRKSLKDLNFNFTSIKKISEINPKNFNLFNCWEEEINITPGEQTEIGGKYAIRSLEVGVQCLADKEIDALVTAPINKANTQSANFPYAGHTHFLKDKFQAKDVVMMLYHEDFKVALVTEHIPINQVSQNLTIEGIIQKAQILNTTLIKDFGIDAPKIAVLGLNPHAGDNGLLGKEEEQIILPAINKLKDKGLLAFGPFSADAYFAHHTYKNFDVTLAMYHDQGLIPFKALAGDQGINYTCGLSIIRTSPDHGTAFDIAGKGLANEESMRNSIFEAINILNQRNAYEKNTANPLVRSEMARERH